MKHALCVGLDYRGTGSDLPDCVIDASNWAAAFQDRGFAVTSLIEGEATGEAIKSGIRALVAGLKYGDLGVLTYSGHGTWVVDQSGDEIDGRDEALCPIDVFTNGPLIDDDLAEIFAERERGARVVFVSDSCHSGTVSKFMSLRSISSAPSDRRVRFMPPEVFLGGKALKKAKSVAALPSKGRILASSAAILMSGCTDTQYSYSTGTNGAFTRAALDALADAPLSYQDWYRFIRQRLPTSEYPQSPQILGAKYQRLWGALEEGR